MTHITDDACDGNVWPNRRLSIKIEHVICPDDVTQLMSLAETLLTVLAVTSLRQEKEE